jgi:hypothetical protein
MAEGNHVEAVEEIGTGQAIHYSLERWTALLVFVDDGRVEMDNNAAELRCGQLRLDVRTTCSLVPLPAAKVPRGYL